MEGQSSLHLAPRPSTTFCTYNDLSSPRGSSAPIKIASHCMPEWSSYKTPLVERKIDSGLRKLALMDYLEASTILSETVPPLPNEETDTFQEEDLFYMSLRDDSPLTSVVAPFSTDEDLPASYIKQIYSLLEKGLIIEEATLTISDTILEAYLSIVMHEDDEWLPLIQKKKLLTSLNERIEHALKLPRLPKEVKDGALAQGSNEAVLQGLQKRIGKALPILALKEEQQNLRSQASSPLSSPRESGPCAGIASTLIVGSIPSAKGQVNYFTHYVNAAPIKSPENPLTTPSSDNLWQTSPISSENSRQEVKKVSKVYTYPSDNEIDDVVFDDESIFRMD